jgi:hypothetical protein
VGRAFVLYWSTDPQRAPGFVQAMPENWVKGLLQLVLGRPRIGRVGTWLAHDWRPVYAKSMSAPGGALGLPSAAAAAPPPTEAPGADTTGAPATSP